MARQKKEIKHGVYGIYLKDGRLAYIGSSNNINRRWNEHKSRLLKGTHSNKSLQTYFINNDLTVDDLEFKILHETKTDDKLILFFTEMLHIDLYEPLFNKMYIRIGRANVSFPKLQQKINPEIFNYL